jgi:hypothetical protein
MKQIDVKDQVTLSFGKCIELVLSGIKFRLFRAAITVVIVSLAVAFLMTMLTESFVAKQVVGEISQRTQPRKTFDFWVGRMQSPLSEKDMVDQLASSDEGSLRRREFAQWGGLSDEQLATLAAVAVRQRSYQRFFEGLSEGKLRPLVGRARGVDIFRYLQDPRAYNAFTEEYAILGLRMPTSVDELKAFLSEWSETEPLRQAILNGNRQAMAALRTDLGGARSTEVLARAEEGLVKTLASHGFYMADDELDVVRQQAGLSADADRMSRLLSIGRIKNRLADRINADLADIDTPMYFSELSSSGGSQWLKEQVDELNETISRLGESLPRDQARLAEMDAQATALEDRISSLESDVADKQRLLGDAPEDAEAAARKALDDAKDALTATQTELQELNEGESDRNTVIRVGLADLRQQVKRDVETERALLPARESIEGFDITAERIRQVAASRMAQRKLAAIEESVAGTAGNEGGLLGYSSRTLWLIGVSFLVCVVGIANAMLMSVTDRFREIATMKCLGATDGYIMVNFILESCLQGTAGGIVGAFLGFILGAMRSFASYGWIAMQHLPWNLIILTAAASLVAGVILSALAAVYPAWIAARLAPMEAMRIE